MNCYRCGKLILEPGKAYGIGPGAACECPYTPTFHGPVFGPSPTEARNAALEDAAKLAETWGNAPPNPNGRRAALAAAIRAMKR